MPLAHGLPLSLVLCLCAGACVGDAKRLLLFDAVMDREGMLTPCVCGGLRLLCPSPPATGSESADEPLSPRRAEAALSSHDTTDDLVRGARYRGPASWRLAYPGGGPATDRLLAYLCIICVRATLSSRCCSSRSCMYDT